MAAPSSRPTAYRPKSAEQTGRGSIPHEGHFRSHVHMARHGFGKGEYRYFKYPLPDLSVTSAPRSIRTSRQSPTRWNERMGIDAALSPTSTPTFFRNVTPQAKPVRRRCCSNMSPGDFNCLHQDLYGELAFPIQIGDPSVANPGKDFTGGEFVLTEQRPRMQSRAEVVPLSQGDAVSSPFTTGRCRAQGQLSRQSAPRRQPRCGAAIAPHPRDHLPRRQVKYRCAAAGCAPRTEGIPRAVAIGSQADQGRRSLCLICPRSTIDTSWRSNEPPRPARRTRP